MTLKKPFLSKHVLTAIFTVLIFSMFTILAFWIPGTAEKDHVSTIFGATTFVFGILIAFYFSTSFSRFNDIITALQTENSTLLYIYYSSRVFNTKIQEQLRDKIDVYLVAELDYFLKDFDKSEEEYKELFDFINNLPVKNESEKVAQGNMLDEAYDSLKSRKLIESLVTASISPLEWVSLFALLIIVLVSLFFLNTNTILSSIMTSTLATTSILLMSTLEQLDTLKWKENRRISLPLARVFKSLGLLPYYPKGSIEEGRFSPLPGKIRVATYPNPYPNMDGKKVETVDWKE